MAADAEFLFVPFFKALDEAISGCSALALRRRPLVFFTGSAAAGGYSVTGGTETLSWVA